MLKFSVQTYRNTHRFMFYSIQQQLHVVLFYNIIMWRYSSIHSSLFHTNIYKHLIQRMPTDDSMYTIPIYSHITFSCQSEHHQTVPVFVELMSLYTIPNPRMLPLGRFLKNTHSSRQCLHIHTLITYFM